MKKYININKYYKNVHSVEKDIESFDNINSIDTYGELNTESFKKIMKGINTNKKVFADIGSGKGKLPIIASYYFNVKKSIGIELCKNKHNYAMVAKKIFLKKYGKPNAPIKFINKNFFDTTIKWEQFDIIYISNLCFTKIMDQKIVKKIDNLKKGTIIFCSRQITSEKLKKIKILKVKQSWSNSSNLHKYIIK